VPTLAALLKDERADARRRAAIALFRIGAAGADAVPELVRGLYDPVGEVADGAALALGRMGSAAVPGLVEALESSDVKVRTRAADALGRIGAEATPAVDGLLRLLQDREAPWKARGNAAWALGLIGASSHQVVSELAKGLEDDDGRVRRECAEALGRLGNAAVGAVPGLIGRVADEYRPARDQAIAALWNLGAPAVEVLVKAFKETHDRAPLIPALAAGGREALPYLVPLLEHAKAPYARDAEKALAAVGWEALLVLPADGASAERVAASVLGDGVRRYCTPSEGFQVKLVPGPTAKPSAVEVVWESGSGHGFTLSLHRSRWTESGLCVRKVGYAWRRPPRAGERGVERVGVRETMIPRRRAEAMLRMTLAATGLRVEEEPLPDEEAERGRRHWMSSADFHAAVVLRVGEHILFREAFTGYLGSLAQVEYARVKACTKILREGLETCAWADVEVSDEDRGVLAARLSSAQEDNWWVLERLLVIAREIGDERCVVALQALIETEPEQIPRRHRYAMDAYARISGVDLRPSPFRDEDVAATRRKYLAHFQERGKSGTGDR